MASSLKPDVLVNPSDLFAQVSPTAGTVPYNTGNPELGVRAVTGDGREFRYVQAGASALIIGQLQQAAAPQSNYIDVTAVAVAAGATTATVAVPIATIVVVVLWLRWFLFCSCTYSRRRGCWCCSCSFRYPRSCCCCTLLMVAVVVNVAVAVLA